MSEWLEESFFTLLPVGQVSNPINNALCGCGMPLAMTTFRAITHIGESSDARDITVCLIQRMSVSVVSLLRALAKSTKEYWEA